MDSKDVKILSRQHCGAADSEMPFIPLPVLCVHPLALSAPLAWTCESLKKTALGEYTPRAHLGQLALDQRLTGAGSWKASSWLQGWDRSELH